MEIKPSDGGMLQTNVTNTGSYIEEDLRATLFDKFMSSQSMNRTVRGQNFGLGLTYSKMAVEALGGRIWVDGDESVPQTTFHFTVKNHEGS
jgi:signal transduction histidine kinase